MALGNAIVMVEIQDGNSRRRVFVALLSGKHFGGSGTSCSLPHRVLAIFACSHRPEGISSVSVSECS